MTDINNYALTISLELRTDSVSGSLDQLGDALNGIESSVSNAAASSLGAIDNNIKKIETEVNSVSRALITVGNANSILIDSMERGSEINASNVEDLDKQLALFKEYYAEYEEFDKLRDTDFTEKELDALGEMVGFLDEYKQGVEEKNRLHKAELGYVEKEGKALFENANRIKDKNERLKNSDKSLRNITILLRTMSALYKAVDQDTERFVTTNYRLYGSQQQITQSARELTMQHGLFAKEAMEAYAILGDLRTPIDQIDKTAEIITKANRNTGVAIKQLADFSFRMRQVGMDAAGMERMMNFATEAMRKFGLSSSDLNSILGSTKLSAAELEYIFSGENQAEKYNELRIAIAGVAKQAGYTTEAAAQMVEQFTSIEGMSALVGRTGQAIKSVEDLGVAIGKMSKVASADFAMIDAATDSITRANYIDNLRQTYKLQSNEQVMFLKNLNDISKRMNLDLSTYAGYQKAMEELRTQGVDPFHESNNTLTAQLRILGDTWTTLKNYVLQPLADAFRDFIKVINVLIWAVTTLVTWFGELWACLKSIPLLGMLFIAIEKGVSYVLLLGTAIFSVGLAIAVIGEGIEIFSRNIARFFDAIGEGFQRLGQRVTSVMAPLLALGAALLMVGAGAYLFAEAVTKIAEGGVAAVAVAVGLGIAIYVLAAALVGLGGAAMAVAPGIILLGAILLSIGATVSMIGFGINLIAQAVSTLADAAIRVVDAEALPRFAKQLVSAAWTLLKAAPIFAAAMLLLLPVSLVFSQVAWAFIIGAAMFALAVGGIGAAAVLFKTGMEALGEGIDLVSKIDFGALLIGMVQLAAAGPAMTGAGKALQPGAKALDASTSILEVAAVAVSKAATLLFNSSGHLKEGVLALSESATTILGIDFVAFDSAVETLIGIGADLIYAAFFFTPGAIAIGAAARLLGSGLATLAYGVEKAAEINFEAMSTNLRSGASDLLAAAPSFTRASFALAPAAFGFGLAGKAMWAGASSVSKSVELLEGVGKKLLELIKDLEKISQPLAKSFESLNAVLPIAGEIGSAMYNASFPLASGARSLIKAAEPLVKAGNTLGEGVKSMEGAVEALSKATETMQALATEVLQTGFKLLFGASFMLAGALRLSASSVLLDKSGRLFLPSAIRLMASIKILELSMRTFKNFGPLLLTFALSLTMIADAMSAISKLDENALFRLADANIKAITRVNAFSDALSASAVRLRSAVDEFKAPMQELAELMNQTDAAAKLRDAAEELKDPVRDIVDMMTEVDSFSQGVNATVPNIDEMISTKAVAASVAMNPMGQENAAEAESISTVKVFSEEMAAGSQGASTTDPKVVDLLSRIVGYLDGSAESGANNNVQSILSLLETYLPDMSGGGGGGSVTSSLAKWKI